MMATLDLLDDTEHRSNKSYSSPGAVLRFEDGPPQVRVIEKDLLAEHDRTDRLPDWWLTEVPHRVLDDDRVDYDIVVAYYPPSFPNTIEKETPGDEEEVVNGANDDEDDDEEEEQVQEDQQQTEQEQYLQGEEQVGTTAEL
jgi:hypothetical protein